MRNWNLEKENLNKLVNEDNLSYIKIGKIYGCTDSNIRKVLKRLNIPVPIRNAKNSKYPHKAHNKKSQNHCLFCGNPINRRNKFCNETCHSKYNKDQYIDRWLRGKESGVKGLDGISKHIRDYLHEIHNNKCELCGWGEINRYTNKVPLQIHHKDGNCMNNRPENLQLLCPNCHALTENYGRRNKHCTRIKKR